MAAPVDDDDVVARDGAGDDNTVCSGRPAKNEVTPVGAEDARRPPLRIRRCADVLEPVAELGHMRADVRARQIAEQPLELRPHRMPPECLAAMVPCPAPQARTVVDLLLQRSQVRRYQACVVLTYGEVEAAGSRLRGLGEGM